MSFHDNTLTQYSCTKVLDDDDIHLNGREKGGGGCDLLSLSLSLHTINIDQPKKAKKQKNKRRRPVDPMNGCIRKESKKNDNNNDNNDKNSDNDKGNINEKFIMKIAKVHHNSGKKEGTYLD